MVHLNGGELYDVEPAATSFESTGSFAVELRNHGQAVHVHLRLDDDLSRVASLAGTNHFVDTESAVTVPVTVAEGAPDVRGALKVVTGYGSGTDAVEVHISDGDDGERVAVDEDLGRPEPGGEGRATRSPDEGERGGLSPPAAGALGGLADAASRLGARAGGVGGPAALGDARSVAAVAFLVVVAIAVAAVALLAAPGLAVVFGIFAVLVGLAVAAYLMVR